MRVDAATTPPSDAALLHVRSRVVQRSGGSFAAFLQHAATASTPAAFLPAPFPPARAPDFADFLTRETARDRADASRPAAFDAFLARANAERPAYPLAPCPPRCCPHDPSDPHAPRGTMIDVTV